VRVGSVRSQACATSLTHCSPSRRSQTV
jgi:hypothetical protein